MNDEDGLEIDAGYSSKDECPCPQLLRITNGTENEKEFQHRFFDTVQVRNACCGLTV